MIKIEITDPHLMDKRTLRNIGVFLFAMAGDTIGLPPDETDATPRNGFTQNLTPEILDNVTESINLENAIVETITDAMHRPDELNETKQTIDGRRGIKITHVEPGVDIEEELIHVPAERVYIPGNGVDRDTDGAEWNSDLHSRTKTKTVDGRWKKKKVFGDKSPPVPSASLAAVFEPTTPPRAPIAPPPPPSLPGKPTFGQLIIKATSAVRSNKISQKDLNDAVKSLGVVSLPMLSGHDDKIEIIWNMLEGLA